MDAPAKVNQKYLFDEEHIVWLLSMAHTPEEARRRAKNLLEDVRRIGIALTIEVLPVHGDVSVPYYKFGETDFSSAKLSNDVPDTLKAVGFGLDWGSLHDLSTICEAGRRIWKDDWVQKSGLRVKLKTPTDHLSAVEELLWLGLWRNPVDVRNEVCLPGAGGKAVDWRFKTCGEIVNLEVKLRPRDWKRLVDGPYYSTVHDSYFEGIAAKFGSSRDNELNLVGITLLAQLDREVQDAAARYLACHEHIDGVVWWSTGTGERHPIDFQLKPRAAHAKLLLDFTLEHRRRFTMVLHPWQTRETRRAKRLGIEVDLSEIDGVRSKVGKLIVPAPPQQFPFLLKI